MTFYYIKSLLFECVKFKLSKSVLTCIGISQGTPLTGKTGKNSKIGKFNKYRLGG